MSEKTNGAVGKSFFDLIDQEKARVKALKNPNRHKNEHHPSYKSEHGWAIRCSFLERLYVVRLSINGKIKTLETQVEQKDLADRVIHWATFTEKAFKSSQKKVENK